jgi:hypothetical protein
MGWQGYDCNPDSLTYFFLGREALTKPADDAKGDSFKTEGADLSRRTSDIQVATAYSFNSEVPAGAVKRPSRDSFDFKNKDPSARKIFYHSIPKYRFPVLPRARWRWAIRKVLEVKYLYPYTAHNRHELRRRC